LAGVRL